MIATLINAAAILVGALAGLLFRKRISESFREVVFVAAGCISLVVGIMMAIQTERVLYMALALVGGGIAGAALRVEHGVLRLGEALRGLGVRLRPRRPVREGEAPVQEAGRFAEGFLEASVLFCVGSMAILGSIQAGTAGDYKLLLTKSVLDGFIAILLAAGLGAGVVASALPVLVYQGAITLLAGVVQSFISPLMLTMISAVGGPMVIMIGINLLGLRKIPTANFLPALVFAVLFALVDPWVPLAFKG